MALYHWYFLLLLVLDYFVASMFTPNCSFDDEHGTGVVSSSTMAAFAFVEYQNLIRYSQYCLSITTFDYVKFQSWPGFLPVLFYCISDHLIFIQTSSSFKSFLPEEPDLPLLKISKEGQLDVSYIINTVIAEHFLHGLISIKDPYVSLDNNIQKSYDFLLSLKEKKKLFPIVKSPKIIAGFLFRFMVTQNLLFDGVKTEAGVDLFLDDYITTSFNIAIPSQRLIIPIKERNVHFIDKTLILITSMTFSMTMPLIDLSHQYLMLSFETYPLLISLFYYFPAASLRSLNEQRALFSGQSIQQTPTGTIVTILADSIFKESQKAFDAMSKYEQFLYFPENLVVSSLHDLEVMSCSIMNFLKSKRVFDYSIEFCRNANFYCRYTVAELTNNVTNFVEATPLSLNLISKNPTELLRRHITTSLPEIFDHFEPKFTTTKYYLQLYFSQMDEYKAMVEWYLLTPTDFKNKLLESVIIPIENECSLVLHALESLLIKLKLPSDLFLEDQNDLVPHIAKFYATNRVTTLKAHMDKFLITLLMSRLKGLSHYQKNVKLWTCAESIKYDASVLRCMLTAFVISSERISLRIIDLYFANSCIFSHRVAISLFTSAMTNANMRKTVIKAFKASIPQDIAIHPDLYKTKVLDYFMQ